jgi:hypothetical protein
MMTLNQQIEELDRELAYRAKVYPRLMAAGKLRASVAEYQVARLKAARETLEWLADREWTIKQRLWPG